MGTLLARYVLRWPAMLGTWATGSIFFSAMLMIMIISLAMIPLERKARKWKARAKAVGGQAKVLRDEFCDSVDMQNEAVSRLYLANKMNPLTEFTFEMPLVGLLKCLVFSELAILVLNPLTIYAGLTQDVLAPYALQAGIDMTQLSWQYGMVTALQSGGMQGAVVDAANALGGGFLWQTGAFESSWRIIVPALLTVYAVVSVVLGVRKGIKAKTPPVRVVVVSGIQALLMGLTVFCSCRIPMGFFLASIGGSLIASGFAKIINGKRKEQEYEPCIITLSEEEKAEIVEMFCKKEEDKHELQH